MSIFSGIAARDFMKNLSVGLGVEDNSIVEEALAFYTVCYFLNIIAVRVGFF